MDLAVLVNVLIFKLGLQNCIDLRVLASRLVYVGVELGLKSLFAWWCCSSFVLQLPVGFHLPVNRIANVLVDACLDSLCPIIGSCSTFIINLTIAWSWLFFSRLALRLQVAQHLLLLGLARGRLLEVLIIILELHHFLI